MVSESINCDATKRGNYAISTKNEITLLLKTINSARDNYRMGCFMNKSDQLYKKTLARNGIKIGLDIAEGLGLISKTERKLMRTRRRGCSTDDRAMLCFLCPYKYGNRNCKRFRKSNNMKVGFFFSGEDIMSKIVESKM